LTGVVGRNFFLNLLFCGLVSSGLGSRLVIMNYYKPKFPLEEPKEVVTRRTERDQGAGLSRTKRRDVFRTRNYKFAKGATYTVKFGFMNEDGRCAMVLCDEHISAETVNLVNY